MTCYRLVAFTMRLGDRWIALVQVATDGEARAEGEARGDEECTTMARAVESAIRAANEASHAA